MRDNNGDQLPHSHGATWATFGKPGGAARRAVRHRHVPLAEAPRRATGARFRLQRLHRHLDEIIEEHEAKAEARSGWPVDEVEDLVDVPLRLRDEPALEFPMTVDRMKAIIFVSATCHLLVVIFHLLGDVFCRWSIDVRDIFVGGTVTSSIDLQDMFRCPRRWRRQRIISRS